MRIRLTASHNRLQLQPSMRRRDLPGAIRLRNLLAPMGREAQCFGQDGFRPSVSGYGQP